MSRDLELKVDNLIMESTKVILTLSSGTLIVSLTVISINAQLAFKGVLYIGWFFLINSIAFGLWGLESGVKKLKRNISGLAGKLEGKLKKMYQEGKVLTKFEGEIPDIALWSFYIGLMSFSIFVLLNVHNKLKW